MNVLALTAIALAADPAPPAAPTVAAGSVLHPTFTVEKKSVHGAGEAFYAKFGDRVVLITAYQLLGPPSGLAAQVPAADVVKQVTAVALNDAWSGLPVGNAGPALQVADAATMDKGAAHDLALFDVSISGFDTIAVNTKVPPAPLELAPADPKVGDVVWLAGPVLGTHAADRLHQAKVGFVDDNAMYVDFAEKDLDLSGTAGSPFVDAQGRVVGMCVGGGVMDGTVVGGANPVDAIRTRITQALGGK